MTHPTHCRGPIRPIVDYPTDLFIAISIYNIYLYISLVALSAGPSLEGPPGCEGFVCILHYLYAMYPCILAFYILSFLCPVCCMLYHVSWIQRTVCCMIGPQSAQSTTPWACSLDLFLHQKTIEKQGPPTDPSLAHKVPKWNPAWPHWSLKWCPK